jgi:GNAT superfamily N-acetyltransferase
VTVPAGYVVRPARPDDVPALPEVERRASALFDGLAVAEGVAEDVTTLADFHAGERAGLLWVAATAAGEVVGFALVEMLDGHAHLDEVDVLPAHGRRGLGAALVRAVCAFAARAGLAAVTLTTFRDVPWNQPFYARLGFRPLAPEAWGPGLVRTVAKEAAIGLDPGDRVVMRCEIG